MKALRLNLVFDLGLHYDADSAEKQFQRSDEKFGFNSYLMFFGRNASISEKSIRSRLIADSGDMFEIYGRRISHPRNIICFNYKTLKHEFYNADNFNDYIEPENFQFPVNFKGSPLKELLKY